MLELSPSGLEVKFCRFDAALTVSDGHVIEATRASSAPATRAATWCRKALMRAA